MKKNDFVIVAILVAMMFVWMRFYPALEQKFFPQPEQPVAVDASEALAEAPERTAEPAAAVIPAVVEKELEAKKPTHPEQFLTLENENVELTVSSYGGAVVSAVLKKYNERNSDDSPPVRLDFSMAPALRYDGVPVLDGSLKEENGRLRYTVDFGNGCFLERTLTLDGEYQLNIEDVFVNRSDLPWMVPAVRLPTGPMSNAAGTSSMRGVISLGVDTFTTGVGVNHWGKEFTKLFKDVSPTTLQFTVTPEPQRSTPRPVDWIAAKSKFFVQILTPGTVANSFDLTVHREGEGKKSMPVEVSAALQFDAALVAANEAVTRNSRMYIGPKDYSMLKTQGQEQVEVMEFRSTGFFKFMNLIMYPVKTGLLWGLKALYKVVRSYGVAIMLLTLIVRVIFWPITHKGTESMRRMQALQPQLKEIREKFKDNPQRMQQETMAFYKENKVNPMGGCLPMLVQIPVFIALFTVLRSAIELRYSNFLWIRDLSEPENLFAGMIPIVGSLNILPLLMSATMIWQQKMTPSAGDPQQQKMMAVMMPVMMLFFFYTMPSGLVLYWTTSNLIMIIQMLIKRKKTA